MESFEDDKLDTTQLLFSHEAREKLYAGLKTAAEAVGCTLGPRGKTVLIQRKNQSPLVTKDGATVAKMIKLRDPVHRMGAELLLEAAGSTNDVAGDGTTTASVLTEALVCEGLKLTKAGYDRTEMCHGIEEATTEVVSALKSAAKQVACPAEISQVATISANGDVVIGSLISQAMEAVGSDGIITVEDAKGMATSLVTTEGLQVDRGYLSPYFVTDAEKMRALYENAYVLVTDKKLSSMREIVPVLEKIAKSQKALLIIADDIEGEALSGLVVNRVKGCLQVVAIKAPGYGQHRSELLNDICVLTGASRVSSATGIDIEKVTLAELGQCKKFITDAKTTTIVGTGSTKEAVDKHISDLKSQLVDVTLAQDEITKLRVRVAKLSSGVAIIRVGGATETEMIERKFRVEDALNATKSAAEEGIVPGGGMALFVAAEEAECRMSVKALGCSPSVSMGRSIVFNACQAPLSRIASNAGKVPQVVLAELARLREKHLEGKEDDPIRTGWGYNAATGEYVNLIEAGVIDPVKVTRTALANAASVASTFLSLDAVVFDDSQREKD